MRSQSVSSLRADDRTLLWGLVLLVALLSAVPLGRLLIEAVMPQGAPSLRVVGTVLSNPATWVAAGHSLEVSLGGTVLAVLIGAVLGFVVCLTDVRARNALIFCFILPVMIPPQVTALAWLQVAGPASPMLKLLGIAPAVGSRNMLYSREGIILLLGIQYAPLIFLTLRAGLRHLPRELIEAALSTGAKPLAVLRTVVLPLMTPPLLAGIALCFVSCIGNFGIPAFLGVPGRYTVLTTLIYQRLAGLGPSVLSEVAVLSMLIGLMAVAGIVLQDVMIRRRDFRTTGASSVAAPFELRGWRLPIEIALWSLAGAMLVVPIIGLVLTSLVSAYGVALNAKTVTLANYAYVLFEHAASQRAFANSFLLSAGAAALIAVLSIPLAYFVVWRKTRLLRALNFMAELPYAIPGVVLAIASILLFLKPLPVLGVTLYNTVWIILFAYLARFLVIGLRPAIGGLHQVDRALEEAAQVAGARLLYRLRTIIFPLIAPAAMAGALLIFLTAFSELTVSALLWSAGAETLGVVVFSLEQGGDSNYASAIAVITLAVIVALMLSTLAFARKLPAGVLPWRD